MTTGSIDELFAQACTALEAHDHERAAEGFRACIELQPDDVPSRLNLAFIEVSAGRAAQAMALYREVADIDPHQSDAIAGLGRLLKDAGDLAGATDLLTRSFERRPGDFVLAHSLGQLLEGRFRVRKAIEIYQEHLRHAPGSFDGTVLLAAAHQKVGRSNDAAEAYRQLLAHDSTEWRACINLAQIFAGNGQPEDAIALYRAFIEANPDSWQVVNNLIHLLGSVGRQSEAIALCRDFAASHPDEWSATNNLAHLLIGTGQQAEAIALWEALLERVPGDHEIIGAISAIGRLTGQTASVGRLTRTAVAAEHEVLPIPADAGGLSTGGPAAVDLPAAGLDPGRAVGLLSANGMLVLRGAFGAADQVALQATRALAIAKFGAGRHGSAKLIDLLADAGAVEALVPPPIRALLDGLFRRPALFKPAHSFARRVVADQLESVVPFHQDASAFSAMGVNLWIPLDPCDGTRPGLQLVVRRIDHAFETTAAYDHNAIEEAEVMQRFGPLLTAPALALGDCILFLSSTIHRSHVSPGMTQQRHSLEIRWG